MGLINRTITYLNERRNRLLNGKINCIPSPFKRFEEDFCGIEQQCYYVITSQTKGSKSQFTSNVFIYNPLLYAFEHPEQIRVKIFYFALEETSERVLQRFMSYLLFRKYNIRISPKELRSTIRPLEQRILDVLSCDEMQRILKFFEDNIIFSDQTNPTGVYKTCKQYAEANGKIYTNDMTINNEFGEKITVKAFDHYEPNDIDEYRIIIIDTLNLIDTEKGLTLKQSMDKTSEYVTKYLRNRFGFTTVAIQQQSVEGESNDSFKTGRIRASVANLGDSKYSARDSEVTLGLFSPARYGLAEYMGYNIKKFGDYIRFLEVLTNRNGQMGGIIALFFDGATCTFRELPLPDDTEHLNQVYRYIESLKNSNANQENHNEQQTQTPAITMLMYCKTLINKLKLWQM